ncbi:glucosaminidase domain-containing protein [Taibaiella soli]|uniref:Peptidoglycan hydrolase n=1 Tax=Taibaiella soli TaxID=1649169 RepID=A0A2W2BFL4_9BACT|nr:glucosaminidase domain-containing protein [Taibaiella soli]PZF72236.1 hypothetical protein DN068_15005 [Taibaiella soli]
MKKWIFTSLFAFLCAHTAVKAQSYQEKVNKYIQQHKALAIAEQRRSGIPAAITLAQGVFETAAGCSELMTQANNHFGIKCRKEWKGETFAHDDDAPQECFRKYSCAYDSYKDHSEYLHSGTRYAALFNLKVTDYSGWAHGLKRCGYATNPKYAPQLIKLIEDFHLQDYTYMAMKADDANTAQALAVAVVPHQTSYQSAQRVVDTPEIQRQTTEVVPDNDKVDVGNAEGTLTVNGLKAFYGHRGDVLLEAAMRYNIRYIRLLEINDLPDAPLEADMFVYLEKKNSKGTHRRHILQKNETLLQVAQAEGMQLKQLRTYNQLGPDEVPVAGSTLYLQEQSNSKPELADPAIVAAARTSKIKVTTDDNTYVYKKPEIPETAKAATATNAAPAVVVTESAKPAETNAPRQPATPVATPVDNATPAPQEPPGTQPVPTQPAAAPVPAPTTTPVPVTASKTDTTVNIAKEKAVGEEDDDDDDTDQPHPAAKTAEPEDELSRLKAKLDKVVYATDNKTTTQAANVPAKTTPTPPAPTVATSTQTAPAAATTSASADGDKFYTVQKGDTAFAIAKRNNITMRQLMDWNHLNFEDLKVGQKLRVKP